MKQTMIYIKTKIFYLLAKLFKAKVCVDSKIDDNFIFQDFYFENKYFKLVLKRYGVVVFTCSGFPSNKTKLHEVSYKFINKISKEYKKRTSFLEDIKTHVNKCDLVQKTVWIDSCTNTWEHMIDKEDLKGIGLN